MMDPDQLAALAAILRDGSFEAAARALHVTPSAVSQRLKALEERVGTVLVERGPPARATPAGARLAQHQQVLGLLERDLAQELASLTGRPLAEDAPLPTVRIAVNADSLATWFFAALAEVEGLLFDLVEDDQSHSADWLRRGEVLAAVTDRAQPVQGCDALPLGRMIYRAVASPAYRDRWFPAGPAVVSLARAPAITFDLKDRLQLDWAARACGQPVRLPTHVVPTAQGFLDAARAGLGWGMLPETMAAPALGRGELVEIGPGTVLEVSLYWQWARMTGAALAPLTRAVRRAAGSALAPM